jgi:hypothetical protein
MSFAEKGIGELEERGIGVYRLTKLATTKMLEDGDIIDSFGITAAWVKGVKSRFELSMEALGSEESEPVRIEPPSEQYPRVPQELIEDILDQYEDGPDQG